jgi:hypothetical protein
MVDAALQTGFVFERWRNIVNAMIEKLSGRPQINKLRVIHLLEADLNLALGIIWSRRLMNKARNWESSETNSGAWIRQQKTQHSFAPWFTLATCVP